MIFSYSAIAFWSLPCWTNFSAVPRSFCLLKPKPNAIEVRTPALIPAERPPILGALPNGSQLHRIFPGKHPRPSEKGRDKAHCKAGAEEPYGYQGLPKGSVRVGEGESGGMPGTALAGRRHGEDPRNESCGELSTRKKICGIDT